MKIQLIRRLFITAAVLATLLAPDAANANARSVSGCTVSQTGGDAGRVNMTCGGVVYYAQTWGSCFTTNAETVKMWGNYMLSAFLSGKKMTVYYDDGVGKAGCTGTNWITGLMITN
jgi:hypothetical protein